jgi:hypothetical protein
MNNQGIDHENVLRVIERAYARAYETLCELHVCKVQTQSPMTAQGSAKDLAMRPKSEVELRIGSKAAFGRRQAGERIEDLTKDKERALPSVKGAHYSRQTSDSSRVGG